MSIGNLPNFTGIIAQRDMNCLLKESLLSVSHDDFEILDQTTQTQIFQIKRQLMAMVKQTKYLYDTNGNCIWILKNPIFKLFHRKYKVYDSRNNLLFTVRSHFRLPGKGKHLTVDLNDGSVIRSRGNFFDRSADICLVTPDNREVIMASITKPLVSVRGMITGLSGYTIRIRQGADVPLCLAFGTILDEERENESLFGAGKKISAVHGMMGGV